MFLRHTEAGHASGPLGWSSQHVSKKGSIGAAGFGGCGGSGGVAGGLAGGSSGSGGEGGGSEGGSEGTGESGGGLGGSGLGTSGGTIGGGASASKNWHPKPAQALHIAHSAASAVPSSRAYVQLPNVGCERLGSQHRVA